LIPIPLLPFRFLFFFPAPAPSSIYTLSLHDALPIYFHPAATNVWGAEYPRVDGTGRVQVRVKAPDATKVRLNFWSGPKLDMEKRSEERRVGKECRYRGWRDDEKEEKGEKKQAEIRCK